MTIEEAAATLGLAPHMVAPDVVERNYRLKAKHCHPDRASYPGAAAEFKRATEAFDFLRQQAVSPTEPISSRVNHDLAEAAESFLFVAIYALPEPWLQLGLADWLGKLAGTHQLQVQKTGTVKKGTPLAELFTGRVNAPSLPLLIAPVDAEVLEFESTRLCRTWILRPLETDHVRRHLERSVAEGLGLESAETRLRKELLKASRLPLSA